jgi:hypothetical protein
MFKVEVDKPANLLAISYIGSIGPKEILLCEEQAKSLVRDLAPGFRLLTDLTELELMDLDCLPSIKRMMDFSNNNGVDMVVRVIPDPKKDIGLNILSLFHYKKRVRIVTCKTLREAREVLGQGSVVATRLS